MYSPQDECKYILKIRVYRQILFDVNLSILYEQFKILEIFLSFWKNQPLGKMCEPQSFTGIVPVSNPGEGSEHSVLGYVDYSERIVTSMAEWLVFLFQQIAVCYPCVKPSLGHNSLILCGNFI